MLRWIYALTAADDEGGNEDKHQCDSHDKYREESLGIEGLRLLQLHALANIRTSVILKRNLA